MSFWILKTISVLVCPAGKTSLAARSRHAHPTRSLLSVSSPKDRAPQSDSASGGRGKPSRGWDCLVPAMAGDHKKMEIPARTCEEVLDEVPRTFHVHVTRRTKNVAQQMLPKFLPCKLDFNHLFSPAKADIIFPEYVRNPDVGPSL